MPRMALAGPSDLATSAAASLVESGGTAVDAAVAMALVAMCTEPGVCAPGAGGFVTIDAGDGVPMVIDGYMAVPGVGFDGGAAHEIVTMEYGGGVTTAIGPGSIAVPGSFASLQLASTRHGRIPWREILNLVADVVALGFPLSRACRTYLVDSGKLIFNRDPAVKEALFDGERLKEIGETVVVEGLADSLRWIGDEGAEVFYRGGLAKSIVADLSERGSALTSTDLVAYRPILRNPMQLNVAGWNVVSNPKPAVGGAAMLGAVSRIASSPDPLRPVVWRDGLVDALKVRLEYEEELRSPSTITVSAVDGTGTAVAATFSAGYGSGVIPSGTGLMMNNSMGELELIPGGPAALVPGARMLSNMAPTTVRSGNDVFALGSPGADRITSALALTLVRLLLAGDDLHEAVEHARLHPESLSPLAVAAERGLELDGGDVRWYDERHMFFGGVNAAGLVNGRLVAHADSRRAGSAVVV
jgi:gamma-glutamyltranspeptidase / glutathione hydrolase